MTTPIYVPRKMNGLSLRYKLLAALTLIPLCGLSVFLWVAISTFSSDKIAHVFDSSLWVSKTRAARVNSEVSSILSISQAVVLTYRGETKNLAETGTYYFERESKFLAFQIFAVNPQTGEYERTVELAKAPVQQPVSESQQIFQDLVAKARTDGIVLEKLALAPGSLLLAARFGDANDPRHVIAVTLIEASDLAQVFNATATDRTFLLRKADGQSLFIAHDPANSSTDGWGSKQVWMELAKKKAPEGISELQSPSARTYLASFSEVGVADLVVVSIVDKAIALTVLDTLMHRSQLLFVAVLALLAIVAAFASRGLTSALSSLSLATRKIAEGDFDARVTIRAGGEIGVLASSFNAMAEEISRLMVETTQKARGEAEFATAKSVQETLFPLPQARVGNVEVAGFHLSAPDCGGNWWYHFEKDDKVYLWIGDVTGHGAPAALLTSAVRAVASVISYGPAMPVGEALEILNRVICEISKGKRMMTFFLACIDKNTGEMTYANASHEPPMILHSTAELATSAEFLPLTGVSGPRLGESVGHKFEEGRVQLQPGDRVVFYTDGVVDVKNREEKTWGERRFLESLAASFHETLSVFDSIEAVVENLREFRESQPLDGDVTLVLLRYEPQMTGTLGSSEEEAA